MFDSNTSNVICAVQLLSWSQWVGTLRCCRRGSYLSRFWAVKKLSENVSLKMQSLRLKTLIFGKFRGKIYIWNIRNFCCRKFATVSLSEFCRKFAVSVGKFQLLARRTFSTMIPQWVANPQWTLFSFPFSFLPHPLYLLSLSSPFFPPLCLLLKQGLGFVLLPENFLKSYITAGEFIGYVSSY